MAAGEIAFSGAAGFLAGVFAASTGIGIITSLILGGVGIGCWIFIYRLPSRKLLLLIPLGIGFFYYHLFINYQQSIRIIKFNTKTEFSGVIHSEPFPSGAIESFTLSLDPPFKGDVNVITHLNSGFEYGDRLVGKGVIEDTTDPTRIPKVAFPELVLAEHNQGNTIKAALLHFKNSIIAVYNRSFPNDLAALMGGITLGVRSEFTKEFRTEMSRSGTTHLVALSGYNVAIIALVCSLVLRRFLSRTMVFICITGIILLFVLMTGAEASVIRAGIMGFLILLAREIGKPYSVRNAITLTAAVMVLWNPTILRFDVGFQLSFLSLLGIVLLEPKLKNLFRLESNHTGLFGIKEHFIETLSAQLPVIPILIFYFKEVSLTALLANMLILEFVPITMMLGGILGILGLLYIPGIILLRFASYLFLFYERTVISIFSVIRIPITGGGWTFALAIVYYSALLALVLMRSSSKSGRRS